MKVYGNLDLRNSGSARFFEASGGGSNYVALRAPAAVSADISFVLPGSDTANGAMVSDGAGNLSLALIANANIAVGANIAYSKLNLASSIMGTDIASNAAIAFSKMAALTASRALTSDASGFVSASSVTSTELGFVSGVTSAIQTQLNAKESTANKGVAGGYASLDGGGKVPVSQLPNSIMEFQGVWNASTNSPTLVDGTGNVGDVYRVNVAGTQNLGSGSQTFIVGDFVIYDAGGIWRLAHAGADAVVSVNGSAGVVTVNAINQLTGDVTAGPASGSQSQAATIAAGAITNAKVNASAAIDYSKLAALTASRALTSDVSGFVSASATTSTELGYVSGVTSAIQTQLNGKASTALSNLTVSGLTANDLLYAASSSAAGRIPVGTNGQVLTVVSGAPAWAAASSTVTSAKTDWTTGTSFSFTHGLNSKDLLVQIYDAVTNEYIQVDSMTHFSTNRIDFVSNTAPTGAGWRVLVLSI